ncbi:MAG TPA: aldo/keto reductase [Acidobacteriaceae bacterium]|jgi:aryl-alcohol dehydrogenase-like predicted oxidoreductase
MVTTPSATGASTKFSTRVLGNSDLHLTPIGYGAWAIGGGNWEFAWGAQDDDESLRTIVEALDRGINWIDTAAIYGLGHSEEIVGKALKQHRGAKPLVFTKCSMRWDENRKIYRSLSAQSLQEELEASLRRLGVDAIDLYQIHWPNPEEQLEEGWETLARFKEQGKVRYIGVSNFSVAQMKRVQKIAPITSLQPPYSILRRDIEKEILRFCLENKIGVINYSPMLSGLLTGKMTAERVKNLPDDDWRKRSPNFQSPKLERNLALVEVLRQIGTARGVEPGVVAIAWTLRQPAVTAAIVGARRPDQVEGVLPAATFRLSESEIVRIENWLAEHP